MIHQGKMVLFILKKGIQSLTVSRMVIYAFGTAQIVQANEPSAQNHKMKARMLETRNISYV